MMGVIRSEEDSSVNFTIKKEDGYFEARYVRRLDDYFVVYLSSQSGCEKACRFCHLTATGQTGLTQATVDDFVLQAKIVLEYYAEEIASENPARIVHFNWMSRGDPMANSCMLNNSSEIFNKLQEMASDLGLSPKFNISTIMPSEVADLDLNKVFPIIKPTIYYSAYSLDNSFRKRWMPYSIPVEDAFDKLKKYQQDSKKIIKIHCAFIEGVNDSVESVQAIIDKVISMRLSVEFNIVRYNPFNDTSAESSEEVIQRNYQLLKSSLQGEVKIIARVGFDVKASCGMFVI